MRPKGALRRLDLILTRKSCLVSEALKARNSRAQGASPGNTDDNKIEPCKGGTEGFCFALTALYFVAYPNPGFRLLRSLHPGLLVRHSVATPDAIPRLRRWDALCEMRVRGRA
jgi:hypothetical protein